jgi:hypothetical protein
MWRLFPMHLYAYVVTCNGVVVSEREQFIYPIVRTRFPTGWSCRWWDGVSGLSGMAWRCVLVTPPDPA